jgi:hypothetical protein
MRIAHHQHSEQRGVCSMKRERLTFELEAETKAAVEAMAREQDRSIGWLLRQMVARGLAERPRRDSETAAGES